MILSLYLFNPSVDVQLLIAGDPQSVQLEKATKEITTTKFKGEPVWPSSKALGW